MGGKTITMTDSQLDKLDLPELKKLVGRKQFLFCLEYVKCFKYATATERAGYCESQVAKREELFLVMTTAKKDQAEKLLEYKKQKEKADVQLRTTGYKILLNRACKAIVRKLSQIDCTEALRGSVIKRLVNMIFYNPSKLIQLAEAARGSYGAFYTMIEATGELDHLSKIKRTTDGSLQVEWYSALDAVAKLSGMMGWQQQTIAVDIPATEDEAMDVLSEKLLNLSKRKDGC